jgi:hypothetical protein
LLLTCQIITVTLEDVSCLWGLPIRGEPVTGITDTTSISDRLYDLLGVTDEEVRGLMKKRGSVTSDVLIAKKALRERFRRLPQNATDEQLRWLVFFLFKTLFVFCISNNVLTF